MKREFRSLNELFNLTAKEINELDTKIYNCFSTAKDMKSFYECLKLIPLNEEQQNFIMFRFGQIEMLNWITNEITEIIEVGKRRAMREPMD